MSTTLRTLTLAGSIVVALTVLAGCCNCGQNDTVDARKGYEVGFNSTSDCKLKASGPEFRQLDFDCKQMSKQQAQTVFMAPCKLPMAGLNDYGFTKATVQHKEGELSCDIPSCTCN